MLMIAPLRQSRSARKAALLTVNVPSVSISITVRKALADMSSGSARKLPAAVNGGWGADGGSPGWGAAARGLVVLSCCGEGRGRAAVDQDV